MVSCCKADKISGKTQKRNQMFTFFAKPLWMDLYLLFAENCLALEKGKKNEIDAKAKEEK